MSRVDLDGGRPLPSSCRRGRRIPKPQLKQRVRSFFFPDRLPSSWGKPLEGRSRSQKSIETRNAFPEMIRHLDECRPACTNFKQPAKATAGPAWNNEKESFVH